MFKFLRRFVFASVLLFSLTLNIALVVSEVAYNIAYGIISNVVSTVFETKELSSSVGWKKSKLTKQLDVIDKKLLESNISLNKQTEEILRLKNERSALQVKTKNLSSTILKRQNEIDLLTKTNQTQLKNLDNKIIELDQLRDKLLNANTRLDTSNNRLIELTQTNKTLQIKHDLAKKNLSELRNDLSGNKVLNKKLSNALTKQNEKVVNLTKSTSAQLIQIEQTKKIIRDTTDRASERIANRVVRNIAAMPFESVPVAGIAVTVGMIYLEIKDACKSLEEFDEMKSVLKLDEKSIVTDKSYCSLTKDDLTRLITNRNNDIEECISKNNSELKSNEENIINCLPKRLEELSIPEFETFEKPKAPEL